MHTLIQEIRREAVKYRAYTVVTVFIGGGTPTAVEPALLCEVIKTIRAEFSMTQDVEFSMEVNPGTVKAESLRQYREAGINRLSIGLQSADNKELALLGRIHSYEDFLETYYQAREAGFTNINVDLMSALPGQRCADYEATLTKVLSLEPKPEHISAYSLIIEEGTPFFEKYGAEKENQHLPTEEEDRKMYELTRSRLGRAGYHRYEISNYSLADYECRHNKVYWQRGDYVGFGLGAASMVDNVRFQNTADLHAYLEVADKVAERQALSVQEQMEEFMFLGLRLTGGVDKQTFLKNFGVSMEEVYGEVIAENVKNGLLTEGSFLTLTEKGLDLANYVMAQFLL